MNTASIITVIGGTGFIGRYVVRELAKHGYRVRVISRRPENALELKTCGNLGQIALLKGDLALPETVIQHLSGSEAVVNLTGILFERRSQRFQSLHAVGPERLAQAARELGIPTFIHISALGIEKAAESAYAHSKLLGERAIQDAFPNATILRPSLIFGPEDNFFNQFARMSKLSPLLPLVGGGKTLFQPVYAADIAQAVVECIRNESTQGKIFELGGPEIFSFRQLMEFILLTLHTKRLLLPLPFPIASMLALPLEWASAVLPAVMPAPPLTRDQVKLLKHDAIVERHALTFATLGIRPQPIEMIVPDYLARFRKHGTGHA